MNKISKILVFCVNQQDELSWLTEPASLTYGRDKKQGTQTLLTLEF